MTTTSAPQASVSSGTAPRLETASTTDSAPASRHTARSGSRSQTTPVEVSEWTRNTVLAAALGECFPQVVGLRGIAPRVSQRHDVAAECPSHRLPPLAELALRDGEDALARREQVDDRRLERSGAGRREHEDLVLRPVHLAQPFLREAEDLREVGRAVVEHRLGERA